MFYLNSPPKNSYCPPSSRGLAGLPEFGGSSTSPIAAAYLCNRSIRESFLPYEKTALNMSIEVKDTRVDFLRRRKRRS